MLDTLKPFLGNIEALTSTSSDGRSDYIHPALRNMGSVSIVLIREIVAPAVFRNQEAEMTDITVGDKQFVRAVPGKFKHKEVAQGLRILRRYKAGGAYPQNRHAAPETLGTGRNAPKLPMSHIFDMNSLVFGASVSQGSRVLPVKAAVMYSDGLSLCDYALAVGKSFHNRAAEDGSLWDPAKKENSNNIFERHFVLPGTLFVQVISSNGRVLPVEGFEHLILSLGEGGAYGGQTSVSGVNVRNHIVGFYASAFERPQTSPYEIAKDVSGSDVEAVAAAIHDVLAPVHEAVVARQDAEAYRATLLAELAGNSPRLVHSYAGAHQKVGDLFEGWFNGK